MPNQKISDINGKVKMVFTDKKTGDIIETYEDNNLFINLGRNAFLRAISTPGSTDHIINALNFGTDFGDPNEWDIFDPEPPALDFTSANQDVIFTISTPALQVTNVAFDRVRFSTVLDGGDVLDLFPGAIDVRYSSLTLTTGNGDPVVYKRFPVKSISRLVSVDVTWDLYFV